MNQGGGGPKSLRDRNVEAGRLRPTAMSDAVTISRGDRRRLAADALSSRVDHHEIVVAGGKIGILAEKLRLRLELRLVGIIVVAIENGEVAARGLRERLHEVEAVGRIALDANNVRAGPVKRLDAIRILRGQLVDDFSRAVAGSVLAHENFEAVGRFLGQDRFQALPDIIRLVVGHDDDADVDPARDNARLCCILHRRLTVC